MKPVLVLPFAVVAALAAGIGYLARVAVEPDDSTATVTPAVDLAQQVTMVTLRESSPEYSIDVAYPQLGVALDSEIRDLVEDRSAQIRDLAREYPPDSVSPGPYTLDGTLHSVFIDPDIVSIRLSLYGYTGGAHGGSTTYGFNLNRRSGTALTLDDALSLIGLSLSELADQSLAQLEADLGTVDFPEGVSSQPENFQTFVVDADEVTFVFQEYQVAPYAAGPQQVSFPRAGALP